MKKREQNFTTVWSEHEHTALMRRPRPTLRRAPPCTRQPFIKGWIENFLLCNRNMSGQFGCSVYTDVYRKGMAEVESPPFSYSHNVIYSPRLTFIKFFQEVRFCFAKAYFIENVSAKPETFRRFEANRFNLTLRIATRANTLYSVLTALCSHPKTFP